MVLSGLSTPGWLYVVFRAPILGFRLYRPVEYIIVQYSTVRYGTVQYSTV